MDNRVNEIISQLQTEASLEISFVGLRQRAKMIVDMLQDHIPDSAKILSLGSGFCKFEALLSQLGYDVVAV